LQHAERRYGGLRAHLALDVFSEASGMPGM
jgi:hypothetical protein